MRHEDGRIVKRDDIEALLKWDPKAEPDREIAFRPARVLLQDFTGVPAVVDLAAMREAITRSAAIPSASTRSCRWTSSSTTRCRSTRSPPRTRYGLNVMLEFERNRERYAFLRWGQQAFRTSASCRRAPASATR